jgi:hypothetical protein
MPRLASAVCFTIFLQAFGWNDRSLGCAERLVTQTKNAKQFRQHYNALLDLLLHQQCPLFARFLRAHFTTLVEPEHLIVPISLHANKMKPTYLPPKH